jgi:hypothetical protein
LFRNSCKECSPAAFSGNEVRQGGAAELETGAGLPDFVKEEFDAFLQCGILAHGFLRLRCADCAHASKKGSSLAITHTKGCDCPRHDRYALNFQALSTMSPHEATRGRPSIWMTKTGNSSLRLTRR